VDSVKKHIKVIVAEILFSAVILSACGLMTPAVYTPLPTYTQTPTRTMQPTFVLRSTFTPTSTITITPAETVSPTLTITPTLKPGALDCNMINSKHTAGVTDLQWAEYTKTLVGKESYFAGIVANVYTNYIVELVPAGKQCNFLLFNIPPNLAIKINKNQFMEGYGAISAIDNAEVIVIHLNVLLDSLIIR
jgi:hypothetical protein